MRFTDINAIYSKKIADLLVEGYMINSNTMGGSQGDIAAIDLRKGDDVIRVRLHKEMCSSFEGDRFWGDNITLTVGRCTDPDVIRSKEYHSYATVWNNKLEVIEERVFWEMGRHQWYIEGEEGKEALRKVISRYSNRKENHPQREFPGMERHMLPAVKRHLGKDRFPVSRIEKIYKSWDSNKCRYVYYASLGNARCVRFG